jgi:undecaprenyl-diphosphatase
MKTKHQAIFILVSAAALILFLAGGWCVTPGHGSASACSPISSVDQWGTSLFAKPFSPALLSVLIFFTSLGDPQSIFLFIAIALLALVLIKERRVAMVFFASLLIGDGLVLAAKNFFNRPRPLDQFHIFNRIGASYPSAHAFIAVVFYGFTAYVLMHHIHIRRHMYARSIQVIITVLTLILIFSIGLSRVALDFHWLSDVIGGWLLGIAVLAPLIYSYTSLHKKVISRV